MTGEERTIQRDRMRFIKNSLSANLALLGIIFDVLYFVSIYQSDVDVYYYNILIGGSIVYNLVFMLAVFLSSEGVKNYKKNYSYVLGAVGLMQFVRIFIIPARAHSATILIGEQEVVVMQNGQFMYVTVCLVLSGICLIASAAVNFIKCRELSEHLESLGIQGT